MSQRFPENKVHFSKQFSLLDLEACIGAVRAWKGWRGEQKVQEFPGQAPAFALWVSEHQGIWAAPHHNPTIDWQAACMDFCSQSNVFTQSWYQQPKARWHLQLTVQRYMVACTYGSMGKSLSVQEMLACISLLEWDKS